MTASRTNARSEELTEWFRALDAKMGEKSDSMDLMLFLWQFDPIWNGDKLDAERSRRLARRVAYLRKDTIEDWEKALEAVHKDGVSVKWTIGSMVSLDRMFTERAFKADESKLLLSRLQALPDETVLAVGKALGISRMHAALQIIDEDAFFENNQLDKKAVDLALKQLKELVPTRTEEPAKAKTPREPAINAERKDAVKSDSGKRTKKANKNTSESRFRTWTSANGDHTTEARLIAVRDGVALLKKRDGKTITVPLEKLSTEDREFLEQRNEQ